MSDTIARHASGRLLVPLRSIRSTNARHTDLTFPEVNGTRMPLLEPNGHVILVTRERHGYRWETHLLDGTSLDGRARTRRGARRRAIRAIEEHRRQVERKTVDDWRDPSAYAPDDTLPGIDLQLNI